jgi:hypothetical protein
MVHPTGSVGVAGAVGPVAPATRPVAARISVAGTVVTSLAGPRIDSAASGAETVAAVAAGGAAASSMVTTLNRGAAGALASAAGATVASLGAELAAMLTGAVRASTRPAGEGLPFFDAARLAGATGGVVCAAGAEPAAGVDVCGAGLGACGCPSGVSPVGPRPEGPTTGLGESASLAVWDVVEESLVVCVVLEGPLAIGPVDPDLVPVLVLDDPPDAVLGVAPQASLEPESVAVEEVCESVGLAHAMPGLADTAAPTPNATANPPTRPMYRAYRIIGLSAAGVVV